MIEVLCKGSTTFFDFVGCCLSDLCSVFDGEHCSCYVRVDCIIFLD